MFVHKKRTEKRKKEREGESRNEKNVPALPHTCSYTTTPFYPPPGDTKINNDLASVSTSILNSFPQLNEMVAASATGATAESLLQSVVNLVGAAQAAAGVTSSAESVSAATSTTEDAGKGTSMIFCVCLYMYVLKKCVYTCK